MDNSTINEKDLVYRKAVGRTYLSNNQLAEAIDAYAKMIQDYPLDVDAYLVLGDLYLAAEDSTAALYIYNKAKLITPDNQEINNRIGLAETEESNYSVGEIPLPLEAERLEFLLQKLTGKSRGVQENEIEKATQLLEKIIRSSNPADLVATHLDQIDTLLPALLEMNIRQAKAERRNDLAQGLTNIQESIGQPQTTLNNLSKGPSDLENLSKVHTVTMLVPEQDSPSVRAQFIHDCISALGIKVEIVHSTDEARLSHPQLVVVCNPHVNPWLLEYMAECTAQKIPTILDLDADYEQMPLNHPEYLFKGLGSPVNARGYAAALLLSNLITTPSQKFAEQLSSSGYHVQCLPDGWSHSNYLWEKKGPKRTTINIGWLGGSGMLEDLVEIRRILIRITREFSKAQLVISEDQKVFQLFENLPENRKMFLPEVSPEDYPFILGQLNILVVPLRNIPFNFTQPDTILMQAGIKRLPWVGSKLPMTVEWNAGGLIASTQDEWHTNLRQLLLDDDTREKLGEMGYQKAKDRELSQMKELWKHSIIQAALDPMNRGFLSRQFPQNTLSDKQ